MILIRGADPFGRKVIDIKIDNGQMIPEEMIENGYAWAFTHHSDNPVLLQFQEEAKAGKKGLWASSNPVPPWE